MGAAIQGIPNFNLAILSNWLYLGLATAVAARGGEAAGLAWPEPAPLAPEADAPSPPRTLAAGAWGAGIQAFRLLLRFRRPVVWVVHLGLVVLSSYLAFWLRFDGAIPEGELALWWGMLPALLLIRGVTFVPFKLYQGVWRYVGIWDLRNIVAGVATSSAIFYLLVHWGLGLTRYPRSVLLVDALLLVCFMAGVRLARRLCRALGQADSGARVLVFGAGDAGEMIVREMVEGQSGEHRPVGFVDDDRKKTGQRIHGVPVLGTRQDLPRIMDEIGPTEVLIAIPRATPRVVRELVQSLEPFKVPIRTLPYLRDILDGRVTVSQIRDLAVGDLLGRLPVTLDAAPVRRLITGKRVLVTGAGGSIGSELCRQIAALEPSALVLYDHNENALWAVENSCEDRSQGGTVHAVVGDVTDAQRVAEVLAEHHPDLIFHAAAHKHVPLMERSPCEAVKNNVTGTRTVAEAAASYGVERFILISSDKAVNPSSVMGATKRVAELMVQAMAGQTRTCFTAVRFGNVLGSNGSVVPRFIEQLRAGGPVTVTHPEVRRYFMLIPEAVLLVLHAAALGEGGTIYVLEMGEEIRVLDMARSLIRLSGFVPDKEIPIEFIGLRPGEKLDEELVGADETVEPSPVPKILRVRPRWTVDPAWLERTVAELEQAAAGGELRAVIDRLREIAPTFRPEDDRPLDGRSPVLPEGLPAVEAVPAPGSP